jgi:import inner membrane translocase subunit TIM13
VQAQALQELTQNLQEKCFDKCITRPNGKLDGKQQNCLALCINRYIDTMKVVSQAMVERGPQVRRTPASWPCLVAGRHISNVVGIFVVYSALSSTDCGLGVVMNESASVYRLADSNLPPLTTGTPEGSRWRLVSRQC